MDKMSGSFLGPQYNEEEIIDFLNKNRIEFEVFDEITLYKNVSQHLVDGKVVGWFQGRMEFGPRSLGSRSILADPRNETMQSVLNLKIKNRESFRPFAPAVLKDHAMEYFNLSLESPYMLLVADVNENFLHHIEQNKATGLQKINQIRSTIPAVTHVNNTARIQTVDQDTNPKFYNLIQQFYEDTNCPLLVNTSFNVRDEPIVCSPEDAYKCFINTNMDVLVLEKLIIKKF